MSDIKGVFAVSSAGMSVERAKLEVAAMNIANANVALPTDGIGYRPLRVVPQHTNARTSFSELMKFDASVPKFSIETIDTPPRQVLEPNHPFADAKGMVMYPAVDTTTETFNVMHAMRAYEANVAVLNASKTMALKALEIGGGN